MLKILSAVFGLSGLLFVLAIIIHKLYISKQKDMMKASHFVAGMTLFMGIYIFSGIILALLFHKIIPSLLILLFALSPFIIGRFATYNTEKIYSIIQIICVLISITIIFI